VADLVEIVLALRNVRQFVSGADKAAGSVEGIGKSTEKAGKQAGLGWKGVAKWAGGAAAVYGAQRFIRGAVDATEDLGKSTLALSRTTGMDVKTSSEWASVLKVRGVQTMTFQRGLTTLSKQIEKTRVGTKKHNSALEQLGFTSNDVAIRTGDTQAVLERVSDRFAKMTNPAKRAALAQQLFSRSGLQLAPILFKGSEAIREQLGLADKYGATVSGKTTKAVVEEMQHQRELKLAYQGVQVQLGTALLPVILQLTRLLVKLTQVVQPLTHNALALKIALGLLTIAFIAWKVATLAATIANLGLNASLLVTVGIIGAVVLALIAIGVAAYFVVKHWDAIKKKAMDVFGWIKKNWPLLVGILLGPFGFAIAKIIQHFDGIQAAARRAITLVIREFQRAVDFIKSIPGKIGSPFKKAIGGVGGLAGKVGGWFGQSGGVAPRSGNVLVGERGPEVVRLPMGANVTPLPGAGGSLAGVGGIGGEATVVVPVYLDRREIARAVGSFTADKLARR
jgi:hypothetical protein